MKTIRRTKRLWLISTLMMALIFTLIPQNAFNKTVQASGKVIVVNPGHMDGVDPGAINSSLGIREVDVNNALAIKVVTTLRSAGYNAMLSHPIPNNPGLPTLLSSKPNYDYFSTTICNAANDLGADLLISIHHNSSSVTSAKGCEFYWSSYHPSIDNDGIYQKYGLWPNGVEADLDSSPPEAAVNAKALANLFNKYFKSLDYVSSNDRIIERDDAIIRKTSMPSVLIEAGYLSNYSECLNMANDSNQQKMANQIRNAINEWFGNIDPMTSSEISAEVDNDKISVNINGISAPNGLTTMYVPVWSTKNGQDDLIWHEAEKQSDGSYQLVIDTVKDHNGDTGDYCIHCYGKDNSGNMTFLGGSGVCIEAVMTASATSVEVSGTKMTVRLSGITAPNGLKQVLVPTWSEKNGQDDLVWYIAEKQSDGSYAIEIDTKNHNNESGEYNIHCYGVDNAGKYTLLAEKKAQVAMEMTASALSVEVSGTKMTVRLSGITAPNGLKQVLVPTWSEKNGQDDLVWYTAEKQSDGSYTLEIDTKNHNSESGEYNVHCYGVDNAGKYTLLSEKTVQVATEMTASTVSVEVSGTKMTVKLSGITAPNGLKQVLVPTWSEKNGQDDLVWYTAEKQSDGSYTLEIDTKNHNSETGEYNVHCYGVDNAGKYTLLAEKTAQVGTAMTASTVSVEVSGTKMMVKLSGITAPNGLRTVYVPTWSEKNGQDDLVWYTAEKQSDGSYTLEIDTKNHNSETGEYNVHCYGVDNDGKYQLLSTKMVEVGDLSDELTASSVKATMIGKDMTIVIDGISAPNGLRTVYVPTWSEKNGQDDIVWYEAEKQSDGSYKLVVNIDEHNGDSGMFQFHAYGVENSGKYVFLGSDSIDIPEFIPIEGAPLVTVDQLVQYYKDSGKIFPQIYIERGVDLEDFVQMYYDEAVTEGIRPEVAFAQMLIETGYLQFGGRVQVTQFNFAGLGAVDGGTGGFDFSEAYGDDAMGIQMGIRAHIQHLKCYASTEDLKNGIVDPRWSNYLRGKAIYLYWLGIPSNPYGTGWSSNWDYGIQIQNKIEDIMD